MTREWLSNNGYNNAIRDIRDNTGGWLDREKALTGHYLREQGITEAEVIKMTDRRMNLDEFLSEHEIPVERFAPSDHIVTMGVGMHYPAGEEILLFDPNSGLVTAEIFFKDREELYEHVHKPILLTKYTHKRETLHHPILDREIEGVTTISRSWSIDSRYRRYARLEMFLHFIEYDEKWDSESRQPKKVESIIMESSFEPTEEGRVSVNTPIEYRETNRSYFVSGHMYFYVPVGEPPRMVRGYRARLALSEEGELVNDETALGMPDTESARQTSEIPSELGEPMVLEF